MLVGDVGPVVVGGLVVTVEVVTGVVVVVTGLVVTGLVVVGGLVVPADRNPIIRSNKDQKPSAFHLSSKLFLMILR